MESLIIMSTFTWIAIFKIVVIFILLGVVLLLGKKYLDAETYSILKAKIVAFEMKAENDIKGKDKGQEKMDYVIKLAEAELLPKEKKLFNRKLAQVIFQTILLPIIFKKKLK